MATVSTLIEEINSSFGKWAVQHKIEGLYSFGFLNYFWGLIIFAGLVIYKGHFDFDPSCIPFLMVLIPL